MAVLKLEGVRKSYGIRAVLREADLVVEPGARVGIVGVNGSGKSTLLKIAAGREEVDAGVVERCRRVAILDQEPELPGRTVGDAIEAVLEEWRALIGEHERIAATLEDQPAKVMDRMLDRMTELQDRIEQAGGWEVRHRTDSILRRVGAPDRERVLTTLSGGERRRVALARVLLQAPELLILDEPTNHLDAETVDWLQGEISAFPGAVLLVTHDRYFLDEVAERIVEVEDGVLVQYEGNYSTWLLAKAERMEILQKSEERRLRLITTETEWALRRPGAQRKHDWARISRLEELKARRPLLKQGTVKLQLVADQGLGGTVLETAALSVRRGGRQLIKGLDLSIGRGERLGVIGPNGSGKTTLLRVLLGELTAETAGADTAISGNVLRGRRTKIGFFSQDRAELDPRMTVREAVGGAERPGDVPGDSVRIGDQDMTLYGYLEWFLFPRDVHDVRLGALSGGERARVVLARLMRMGSNVLILDEPTNDLDLVTLRVLEQALLEFGGAAVVVTHDRWFLDRVATSVLAFEGEGLVVRYGDFGQFRRAKADKEAQERAQNNARRQEAERREAEARKRMTPEEKKGRLSFKEQQELAGLPLKIEQAEAKKAALEAQVADPVMYRGPLATLRAVQQDLGSLEKELPRLYARWEDLEARK